MSPEHVELTPEDLAHTTSPSPTPSQCFKN